MFLGSREINHRKLDALVLLATLAFLYLLVFKLPLYPYFYEKDHLIFLYNADRIFHGEMPYRDFFSFTFPGTDVVYLFLFSVFGLRYIVLPIAIIAAGMLLFWTGLKLSRTALNGAAAYVPAIVYIFFGFRWFGVEGSHRLFAPLFINIGLWAFARTRSTLVLAVVGACCAFSSYFTQQRGVFAVFGFCVFLFAEDLFTGNGIRRSIRDSFVLAVAFLVSLFLLCLPFIASAGCGQFAFDTFTYPAQYYSQHPDNTYAIFFTELKRELTIDGSGKLFSAPAALLYGLIVPLTHIAFFAYFWRERKNHDWSFWRVPMLLAIVGAIVLLGSTAPMHVRFFNISIPSLILFFWLVGRIEWISRNSQSLSYAIMTLLIMIGFVLATRFQLLPGVEIVHLPVGQVAVVPPNDQFQRFVWLRDHTSPGEYVYEVYEPYINFPLQLKNPTRIGQVFPNGYTSKEQIETVIEDLSKNRPRFIVWDNSYNKPADKRATSDHTGPLSDYVQQQYEPVDRIYMIADHPIQIWQEKVNKKFCQPTLSSARQSFGADCPASLSPAGQIRVR
jgi:hypothetical protein